MTMLKKAIASLVACVFMMSMLTLDVMADSEKFTIGDATLTVFWNKTSTMSTVSAFLDRTGGNIRISMVGKYYVNGTDVKIVSNDTEGTTSSQVTISNSGGRWISLNVTVHASYGGYEKSVNLQL